MINSKNALMRALKEDKSKIKFKTNGKIVDSHVWLNEIDVKNNVITFKEKYGDIQIEIIEVA